MYVTKCIFQFPADGSTCSLQGNYSPFLKKALIIKSYTKLKYILIPKALKLASWGCPLEDAAPDISVLGRGAKR